MQNIKGIPIKEFTEILGQYADDADMYLLNEQKSVKTVFEVLERFKNHTGFTLNYEKPTIMRIGSLKKSNAKIYTKNAIKWSNRPVNVLGVWIGTDMELVQKMNWESIIDKCNATLKRWSGRSLSLMGKVCVINTLIASLFVYKMSVLPSPSQSVIKQIHVMIERFLYGMEQGLKYL